MKTDIRALAAACFFAFVSLTFAHPGAHATLEYLSARIANEPESAALYYQRGVAYSNDGQYGNALTDLEYAARLDDSQPVDFQLGVVFYRMQNFEAAHNSFNTTLKLRPDDIRALQYRAKLLQHCEDYAGALRDYQHLFKLPGQVGPVDYMAASSLALKLPQYGVDTALDILDQGMENIGNVPLLQHRAIELELTLGQYQRAISRQQSLADDTDAGPFWQFEMGKLLRAAGQTDLAFEHFATAERQLEDLRKTPARMQLAEELQASLTP